MKSMKNILIAALSLLFVANSVVEASGKDAPDLRVMSYNIRYNNPNDGVNAWANRKDHVAEMIGKKYQADIAGLQEAKKEQIADLQERLPEYTWFGIGRDDGWDKGEFMAIFYRKDRLELLQHNTFWLSETPEIPGALSWNSACNRVVTWAKFKDLINGNIFYHFNTHFDHKSQPARVESAKLVWGKIKSISGDAPAFLTGDFNLFETNEAYAILTGKTATDQGKSDLLDARYISKTEHKGPTSTFTREGWTKHGPPNSKIDYIFVRNGCIVQSHQIANDQYDGRFPSDHLPVIVELAFPVKK
jgi:endonuclease/exonuclease/phosphatase family metal-dependent hydrolase